MQVYLIVTSTYFEFDRIVLYKFMFRITSFIKIIKWRISPIRFFRPEQPITRYFWNIEEKSSFEYLQKNQSFTFIFGRIYEIKLPLTTSFERMSFIFRIINVAEAEQLQELFGFLDSRWHWKQEKENVKGKIFSQRSSNLDYSQEQVTIMTI